MSKTYQRFLEASRKRADRVAAWRNSGQTMQQIADRLGISRQRVNAILVARRKREGKA